MKTWLTTLAIISLIFVSCDSGNKKPQKFSSILTRQRMHTNPHTFTNLGSENCEDYLVVMSSSKLARKLKKPKDWVVSHYQVPLQVDTLKTGGRVIGHVQPGSHCFIVQHEGTWFYIQTPGNNELGWIHQEFVVGFVKKDPETLLPCIG